MKTSTTIRRKSSLLRLQSQMQTNQKNTKEGIVNLNEKDLKRINKEIDILKSKV